MLRKLLALALMTVSVRPVRAADGAEWKALFGPAARRGWAQCGPGKFSFQNGVATTAGGMGLWRFTNRVFTNFVLRGEFKQEHPTADSGVFVLFCNLRTEELP
jgi:hypothetical protein